MKDVFYLTTLLALIFTAPTMLKGQSKNESVQIQSSTEVELRRSLTFEKDSKNEDISISINKKILRLDLLVGAKVDEGKIIVEIYSPSGKKEWDITVGNQTNSNKNEVVYGTIKKMLIEPEAGDWIVKLKPENATATIDIRTKSVEN